VEDRELVAIVLEEPQLGVDVELEAVRRRGGVPPTRVLKEFRLDDSDDSTNVGDKILVDQFSDGDIVDVVGKSKGRGFAGVVKRHGFHGGPKTHGQSDRLRAPGSIGAGTSPGKVWKGMKMAGHMGITQATVKSLRVVRADAERGVLMIRGSVPGNNGILVKIRKSTRSQARR